MTRPLTMEVVDEAIDRARNQRLGDRDVAMVSHATPPELFEGGRILLEQSGRTLREYTVADLKALKRTMESQVEAPVPAKGDSATRSARRETEVKEK